MIVFSESFDAFKQTSNSFLQALNRGKVRKRDSERERKRGRESERERGGGKGRKKGRDERERRSALI